MYSIYAWLFSPSSNDCHAQAVCKDFFCQPFPIIVISNCGGMGYAQVYIMD